MNDPFVQAAAWWTADAGPPRAELLPRDRRAKAGFPSRILAHVLGRLGSTTTLEPLPWVLGAPVALHDAVLAVSALRAAVPPVRGLTLVHAGHATIAMTLLEAIALLVEHEAVLVAFAQDATPPYSEALASALVLSRRATPESRLRLVAPRLHRTRSHSRFREDARPSLDAALRLARAIDVGQPTVETVPSDRPDGTESWQIELRRAF